MIKQKYSCFIFLFSCLLLISSYKVNCESSLNIQNTVILPLEKEHDLVINPNFKIEITLKDEDNNNIVITEYDEMFDDFECITNENRYLHKHINSENKLICSLINKCLLTETSRTIVYLKYNGTLLKEYKIFNPEDNIDLSLTSISLPYYTNMATENDITSVARIYDIRGNPIIMKKSQSNPDYSKIKCSGNNPSGVKKDFNDHSNTVTCRASEKKTGSYTMKMEYEISHTNKKTILEGYYEITPSFLWDPNLSTIQFPSIIYRFSPLTVTVTEFRDKYGNINNGELSYIKLTLFSINGAMLGSSQVLDGGSSRTFTWTPTWPYSDTVRIRICQDEGACRYSGVMHYF